MLNELIDHNPDFIKLRQEGYAIEIRDGFLLMHEVPYVNSECHINYGILVSDLGSISGNSTMSPITQHVAYFIGEHPCNFDGTIISGIKNSSGDQPLAKDLVVNHTFSNKPENGYIDYYDKMTSYATVITSQAKAIDDSVTEKPFMIIASETQETIFNYPDTNSSKAKINMISSKLEGQKLAIIGLGGTGSYLVDLIAKTPVKEIHLYDGDVFIQHNAFRSPGAPSFDELCLLNKKTDYFKKIYSNMRKNIHSHSYNITSINIQELSDMDFVFICIDKGQIKKLIVDYLISRDISFIDVGMGVEVVDDCLIGLIRVTASTTQKRDHIKVRIPFSDDGLPNDYNSNIQIADLNALNAALAVIKWKKMYNFYQDLNNDFNSTYSVNDGILINEDNIT